MLEPITQSRCEFPVLLLCLSVAGTCLKLELHLDEPNCPPQPPFVLSQLVARAELFSYVIAPTRG